MPRKIIKMIIGFDLETTGLDKNNDKIITNVNT